MFSKYILNVNRTTATCMIYGELGLYPVEMHCTQKVLAFWANIVNADENKICVTLYKFMYNLLSQNIFTFKWLEFVKEILSNLNMISFWNNQKVRKIESFKENVKSALNQKYNEKWQLEVFQSRKCTNYCMFKRELKFEKYLTLLPKNLRINFTKFRLSNHKLPIEIGRHQGIERADRKCNLCEIVGDEYHAIFQCPFFHEQRTKVIRKEFHFTANADNYLDIFSTHNVVELNNLAKFCKNIIKFYK